MGSFSLRVPPLISRAFFLSLVVALSAHAGSLRTRDGKFLEGAVQLDAPGGIKITLPTGEQQKFPLASVETAVFTSSAASSLPPEVASLMKGRGNGLLGTYYERVDLSGRSVHRLDEAILFDWELGEPIAGVQKDYFSARWAGQLEAPVSGKFTFHLDADDGARLWLADRLICDAWRVADSVEISGEIELKAGQRYDLRLEYYDNLGPARLRLSWTGPGIPKSIVPRNQLYAALSGKPAEIPPTRGLLAAYFRRTELDSISAVTRLDPQLDFAWGGNAPVSEVPAESFSVRWSGQVAAQFTESYTFHVESGGGAKLWLDGQLILNQWNDKPGEFYSTVVPLTAGQKYDLRLEHFNTGKDAKLRLLWSSASQRKSPIPTDALTPSRPADSGARKQPHGLLGTYFSRADCSGEVLKRLDAQVNFDWAAQPAAPGVPTEDFSVRWLGQLQAQHSENYTFHVEADDGVRVWLGNRQIIDEWRQQSTTVVSQPVALNAGQFYPLTIEYYSAKPPAMAKLKWSSPSTPLGVIPANRLFPPNAPNAPVPGERRLGLDRGVVTWDGSFLAAPLVSADDTSLQFGGAQKNFSLSTVNAARIVFQNLSAQRAAKIESGRAGVLLVNGDFVDGEFKELDRGRVKLSSVLFGLKSFDATYEVVAVILRDPAPGTPTFRVKASDGSVLLLKKFTIAPDGLTIEDSTLRGYKVPAQELVEIRQGGPNLFSAALRLGPQSIHAEQTRVDLASEREWKAKGEAVRSLIAAENEKRARMDLEEDLKIRAEINAVSEAERALKTALTKLAEQQDVLTKAKMSLQTAEAAAATARAQSHQALAAHDVKSADTEKLKKQHEQAKSALPQRGQEFLAATRTRETTNTKWIQELSAADNARASARNRFAAAKQDEANRSKSAAAVRNTTALIAEQAESARTKAEVAWKLAHADLQKAGAALEQAKKSLGATKQPPDIAAKTRLADEARVRRDRAQLDESAKKRELDRLAGDVTAKSTAAKAAQAMLEKTEREARETKVKAEEQFQLAEHRLTEVKLAREKQLAELDAKITKADQARNQANKEATDLGIEFQKLSRERDQLKTAASFANSMAERAMEEAALRKRAMQHAESQVMLQNERKLTIEKQLADAKGTIEKRARAQFR